MSRSCDEHGKKENGAKTIGLCIETDITFDGNTGRRCTWRLSLVNSYRSPAFGRLLCILSEAPNQAGISLCFIFTIRLERYTVYQRVNHDELSQKVTD